MTVVRDSAAVRVSEPVSGARRRRLQTPSRGRSGKVIILVVDKAVMEAAKAALRPGEKIKIVHETEVRTVYRD